MAWKRRHELQLRSIIWIIPQHLYSKSSPRCYNNKGYHNKKEINHTKTSAKEKANRKASLHHHVTYAD
eukprot:3691243-Amphidinium_carterae.1